VSSFARGDIGSGLKSLRSAFKQSANHSPRRIERTLVQGVHMGIEGRAVACSSLPRRMAEEPCDLGRTPRPRTAVGEPMRTLGLGTRQRLFPSSLPRTLVPFICAILSVGFAGCAKVNQLTVTPTTVCAGESVNVSWRTCGTTTLTQVPLRPGQSDECVDSLPVGANPEHVSNYGTVERQASGDAVFYVEAKGWLGKPVHKCVRVFVNEVLPLAGVPQCAGPRAIRVVVSRPVGASWSGRAIVGVVQNVNDVRVLVRHGGRDVNLAPRETTRAFSETDPGGDWTIKSDLPDGPDCGQAGAKVPSALSLQVNPLCKR